MNQSQRKFFIKRIEELAHAKNCELENARAKECKSLISTRDRVVAYMKMYPEKAAKDLYVAAKEAFARSRTYPEIRLYGDDPDPSFFKRIHAEFKKDESSIYAAYEEKLAKVRAEKKKIIDRAYFEELPAEFLKLLEKFEAFKV